jgi:hypothetical protein
VKPPKKTTDQKCQISDLKPEPRNLLVRRLYNNFISEQCRCSLQSAVLGGNYSLSANTLKMRCILELVDRYAAATENNSLTMVTLI